MLNFPAFSAALALIYLNETCTVSTTIKHRITLAAFQEDIWLNLVAGYKICTISGKFSNIIFPKVLCEKCPLGQIWASHTLVKQHPLQSIYLSVYLSMIYLSYV